MIDIETKTKLFHAIKSNNIEWIQMLLESGETMVEIDQLTNGDGWNPLLYSLIVSNDCFSFFVKNGSNLDARIPSGATAMIIAAIDGNDRAIQELHSSGADINAFNADGINPCMSAAAGGQWLSLQLLTELGGNIHARDANGDQAIHHAAIRGQDFCLKILIEKGADINVVNNNELTPIGAAALFGRQSCVQLLLQAGGEINVKTYGKTPAEMAQEMGHDQIAHYLNAFDQSSNEKKILEGSVKNSDGSTKVSSL